MTSTTDQPLGLRERKRKRTRATIQEHALRLFADNGYDATTCEEIAVAAEISPATFYRYFITKEDVVLADNYDDVITHLIKLQSPKLPVYLRIQNAFLQGIRQVWATDRRSLRIRSELILKTPKIRARQMEQQSTTAQMVIEALGVDTKNLDYFRVRVVTAACVAALVTAIEQWVDKPSKTDLVDLVAEAFRTLEQDTLRAS